MESPMATPSPPSSPSPSGSSSPLISVSDLRDYFECPICLCVPRAPPIYQCAQGHLVCGECRPRIDLCPICRVPLTRDSRLLFAERLLEERLPVPCSFNPDGCPAELVAAALRLHEAECPFAPKPCENATRGCSMRVQAKNRAEHAALCEFRVIKCPLISCQELIVYRTTEEHLKDRHFALRSRLCAIFSEPVLLVAVIVCLLSLVANAFFVWGA